MNANQRIHGPYFPSHSTVHSLPHFTNHKQLNHWCEEMEACTPHLKEQEDEKGQKSKIIKIAPFSFTK